MQKIARYILADYLLVFALALLVLVGLLLFVGAMLDLPKDIGAAEMLLMLPYLLPEAIRNAMQAAALFAACSVFGRLSGANELLALSSLGISPLLVIRPVLLIACLLSLVCVWLYDVGESWGKKGIDRVVVDSAEAIAYRYLRTQRSYNKGNVTLNVQGVEGRKLLRPTLIMETDDQPGAVTVSAEEGELRRQGHDRSLSLVLRNGTAYISDDAVVAFPDQIIPLGEVSPRRPIWPPQNCSFADLIEGIKQEQITIESIERAMPDFSRSQGALTGFHGIPNGRVAAALKKEHEQLSWFEAQANRRWANGFFCLAFVMIGVPVSMRIRSQDYLTSFFACFLPIVLLNHPLHNFCIKLAESGRAPPALPWLGDLVLVGAGIWLLSRSLRH